MVTIKNDIESSGVFIPTSQQQPVKDVNLKQEEARQQPRRRSYRCVTIVSVVVLLLIGLGVGSVLFFGPARNRSPTTEANGERTVATSTEEPSSSQPPTFSDPDDRTSDEPEIVVTSAEDSDYDDEIDIDEAATSSTTSTSSTSTTSTTSTTTSTTTTTTTTAPHWIDRGSGDISDSSEDNDDDDTEDYDRGSGSGFGGL